MASRRWIRATFLAASIALLPGQFARSQEPPAPISTTPPDAPADPQPLVEQNITELNTRLIALPPAGSLDDAAVEQQREEAARRLISRPSPRTTQLLLIALQSPNSRLAVVRAIADAPQPDPAFISPLLPLVGGDRVLSDDAARALARFGNDPAVRQRLISFAVDGKQPAALRLGVIRALGDIVKRDVADSLISLISDAKEAAPVQDAAALALARLTGETRLGRDADRWKAWQDANDTKPEIAWQADVLAARDAAMAFQAKTGGDFQAELQHIIDETYDRADQNGQYAIIMRLLLSPEPHTRLMGVQKVAYRHNNGKANPPAAPQRLEYMIGDSDPEVRKRVAEVIGSLNDLAGLDPILAQLPQEPSIDAKIAQIGALGQMTRIRAIPELQNLLRDPSIRVALQAVAAIVKVAPTLRDQNPALAQQVAADLWQVGNSRTNEPDGEKFRVATIEAVGAFHDRTLELDLLGLLNVANSAPIRSAALRALAEMHDPATSFQIATWLQTEPLPAVRMDAIGALGATTTFEDAADTLHRFMSPNTEPDAAVRDRAWLEFQSLLPKAANVQVLSRWATEFPDEPSRRLAVLLQLNSIYQRDLRWDDLALSRQNTGVTYLQPPLSDPAKAAVEFEAALDHWQKNGVVNQVTVLLVKQFFQALFSAKQYDKLATVAGKLIARDGAQQRPVGSMIQGEVSRLVEAGVRDNDAAKLTDALHLTQATLKMQPPLDDRYLTDLRQSQQDIEARLKTPK